MKKASAAVLELIFTPEGFRCDSVAAADLPSAACQWRDSCGEDAAQAAYDLSFGGEAEWFSPSLRFLYRAAVSFLNALTDKPELELLRERVLVEPEPEVASGLLSAAPYALGGEYLDAAWLARLYVALNQVFSRELAAYPGSVVLYLAEKDQDLRAPERIFFHLVENRDEEYPFAFLATYASQDAQGQVRHQPLRYALTEYREQQQRLLALLACLNRAAEASPLIEGFMASGELFSPLGLSRQEAYTFLQDSPAIQEAGILCRIPNWWKKRSQRLSLQLTIGKNAPSLLGLNSLLELQPQLLLDGVAIGREELAALLAQTQGLAQLKGKWVAVEPERLRQLLTQYDQALEQREITLGQALKQGLNDDAAISNGEWLTTLLSRLRRPEQDAPPLPESFNCTLRPYQQRGYAWLYAMGAMGLGACLADDMGLGKTVQVIAYLERLRLEKPQALALLIVPASLLGNWQKELERFAPQLPWQLIHGPAAKRFAAQVSAGEPQPFLTLTTYGLAAREAAFTALSWQVIILDEAQAIKNPSAKQTRQLKLLPGQTRIAMTGTPVENNLGNLWSLMDFLNQGLLGSAREFGRYADSLAASPQGYGRLRQTLGPFILRRLKTDPAIVAELPEKSEIDDYAQLSKKQIVLYRQAVAELEARMAEGGPAAQGAVLAALSKLKQICNHPDQYLGESAYSPTDSGKFQVLAELCETIYEKRERVLVFTQFRELTEPLSAYLSGLFHQPGLVLHGGVSPARRSQLVERFQGPDYIPYLVLSLKAGGVGLNLTAANHVIHFDRWWNPAVERQAEDRAFRIGQKKNVMVHRLICLDTVEEKIDALIRRKSALAADVIGGGESWLSALSDREILSLLRLEKGGR